MAERQVEILDVGQDRIELRALGACSECGGCGGRCQWFGDAAGRDRLRLTRSAFPCDPQPGERWRLVIEDRELLRQSWFGYGRVLLGLLGGAGAGHLAATWVPIAPDAPAALGAAAGTLLALRLSKRARIGGPRAIERLPPA